MFHSPQDGHWPCHRAASAPHAEQTNTVRSFGIAATRLEERDASMRIPTEAGAGDCGPSRGLAHKTLKNRRRQYHNAICPFMIRGLGDR